MLISHLKQACLLRQRRPALSIFRFFSQTRHYDIVIAGGGMVGTTLACTLGKNKKLDDKKILLLEANEAKAWNLPEKYSNRVVSINPGSYRLLKDIGAWDFIKMARFATVKRLQIWDALSETSITFGKSQHTETVSYIVENDLLLASAAQQASKCPNIETLYEARVKTYKLPQYQDSQVRICLENGEQFTCDLLMGCDGANSSVREAMQADYVSWSYHQMGVVGTVRFCDTINNEIAWQRFLPNGPIALLPLTNESSSIVWSTTYQEAERLLRLSEEEFANELNQAIWGAFNRPPLVLQATSIFDNLLRALNWSQDDVRQLPPKIKTVEAGSRAAFPLGFGHSSQYIGKGVVLVGDAAHRIHPLAGQGVNLGFGDISCLNRVLGDAVYSGSTINDLNYLKDYESERQKHNVLTMLAVEGLHRLYTTNLSPIVLLRSLGLQATHALEPVKMTIFRESYSGRRPPERARKCSKRNI